MSEQNQSTQAAGKKSSKDRWVKIGFLVVILAVAAGIYIKHYIDSKTEGWGGDWPAALGQARQDNAKVLAFFTRSPMSYDDREFLDQRLKHSKVTTVLDKLDYVKVRLNTSKHKALAEKYGITDTPALLVVDADGKELAKHIGFTSKLNIITFLKTNH